RGLRGIERRRCAVGVLRRARGRALRARLDAHLVGEKEAEKEAEHETDETEDDVARQALRAHGLGRERRSNVRGARLRSGRLRGALARFRVRFFDLLFGLKSGFAGRWRG